jgi:hypothetical protein
VAARLIDLVFRDKRIRIVEDEAILAVFARAFIHPTQVYASARYPGAPRILRYHMDRGPKLETTVGSFEGFGDDLVKYFNHDGHFLSPPSAEAWRARTTSAREVINYRFTMIKACDGEPSRALQQAPEVP